MLVIVAIAVPCPFASRALKEITARRAASSTSESVAVPW
jgi:hypothetical protein